MPLDDKICEVLQGLMRPQLAQLTQPDQPAQTLGDFDVEQVRRMEALTARERLACHSLGAARAKEKLEQCRGVGDDQRRSRSSRTTCVGDLRPR